MFVSGRPVHRLDWARPGATAAGRAARVRRDSLRSGHRRESKDRSKDRRAGASPDVGPHGGGADPGRSQARRARSVSRAPFRRRHRPPPAKQEKRRALVLKQRHKVKVLPLHVAGAYPAMVTRAELQHTNQLRCLRIDASDEQIVPLLGDDELQLLFRRHRRNHTDLEVLARWRKLEREVMSK